jgi:8-oxo-dGTP pyrophosphatase MutT (NUDIX family)
MRYGGEYKFAGGSKDHGETVEQTARRELSEEFGVVVPQDAVLRPFRVNST